MQERAITVFNTSSPSDLGRNSIRLLVLTIEIMASGNQVSNHCQTILRMSRAIFVDNQMQISCRDLGHAVSRKCIITYLKSWSDPFLCKSRSRHKLRLNPSTSIFLGKRKNVQNSERRQNNWLSVNMIKSVRMPDDE